MRVYFSGGSPIAETGLRDPPADIMLSYYVDTRAKRTKPNARMREIFKAREKRKELKRGKSKGKATKKRKAEKSPD